MLRQADFYYLYAQAGQDVFVLNGTAWRGRDTDSHVYHPLTASRSSSGMRLMLMPTIGSPSAAADFGQNLRVVVVGDGLDDGPLRLTGSPLLKMPLPTKTPSIPSCIISAASAGWRCPRRRS